MIVDPSEQSKQDVKEIVFYINQQNSRAALRFLDCIEKTYSMLSKFPQMGHTPCFDFVKDLQTITVKSFQEYAIYYRIVDDVVRVDRVAHGKRDLPNLFRYEKNL